MTYQEKADAIVAKYNYNNSPISEENLEESRKLTNALRTLDLEGVITPADIIRTPFVVFYRIYSHHVNGHGVFIYVGRNVYTARLYFRRKKWFKVLAELPRNNKEEEILQGRAKKIIDNCYRNYFPD